MIQGSCQTPIIQIWWDQEPDFHICLLVISALHLLDLTDTKKRDPMVWKLLSKPCVYGSAPARTGSAVSVTPSARRGCPQVSFAEDKVWV